MNSGLLIKAASSLDNSSCHTTQKIIKSIKINYIQCLLQTNTMNYGEKDSPHNLSENKLGFFSIFLQYNKSNPVIFVCTFMGIINIVRLAKY